MVTGVKLSQIASGGAYSPTTDTLVAVRSGTTDVLVNNISALAITQTIAQAAHGFSVNNVLRISSTNVYVLALADNLADSQATGIVTTVIDANNFIMTTFGVVSFSGLSPNVLYYLSNSTPGGITISVASTGVIRPLMIGLGGGFGLFIPSLIPDPRLWISGENAAGFNLIGLGKIQTSANVTVLDAVAKTLNTSNTAVSVHISQRALEDSTNNKALTWSVGSYNLNDSGGNLSRDWDAREDFDGNGNVAIDYSGSQNASAGLSFDFSQNAYLSEGLTVQGQITSEAGMMLGGGSYNGDGSGLTNIPATSITGGAFDANGNALTNINMHGFIMAFPSGSTIEDGSGTTVITPSLHTLYDNTGTLSGDWANRFLYFTNGSTEAIDYSGSGFNASAGISFGQSAVIDTYIGGVIRSGNDSNTSVNANGRTLGDASNNTSWDYGNRQGIASDGSTLILDYSSPSGLNINKKVINYNGTATAGNGVESIPGYNRLTAKTSAQASVATFTPSADGSFRVSANILITASTLYSFTATCTYTDEGNTSRTLTLPFVSIAGTVLTTLANAGGAVPYEGVPVHIRSKAATAITIATTGTFTTVTYNAEGCITQIA